MIRGKAFSAGSNSYIYTDSTDEMTKFSFEYKVTNDGAMDVLIGNDNGQYGNFYLNANGTITSVSDTTAKTYAGVTTVTDLGDGWVLVEVPMSVIGVADYLAEFAIRFYDTNAAGTFILDEMYFIP